MGAYADAVLADSPLLWWPLNEAIPSPKLKLCASGVGSTASNAIFWQPQTIDGVTYTFTCLMSSSGADGSCIMFLDPAIESVRSLGGQGGSVGYGGLAGAALKLDLFSNQVQWFYSATHAAPTAQQTTASASPGGTHTWTVAFAKTAANTYTVTVTKDGSAFATYTGVNAPDVALVGFGGATGGSTATVAITAFSSTSSMSLSENGWSLNSDHIETAFFYTGSTYSIADASGNGHTGTANNDGIGNAVPLADRNLYGRVGKVFEKGASGRVTSSYTLPSLSAFSVEYWLMRCAESGGASRLMANSHTDVDHLGFQVGEATHWPNINFQLSGSGASTVGSSTGTQTTAPTDPNWHHQVFTYDGSQCVVYVDGVAVQTTTGLSGTLLTSSTAFGIGFNPSYSGDYWSGLLADVALYGSGLSAARVLAHYNAGRQLNQRAFPPSQPALARASTR